VSRKELTTNRFVISGELFNYITFIQILNRDENTQKLLDDISIQMEDYQALQQTKTALDMEIAVYKRLLESEEDRLGIDKGNISRQDMRLTLAVVSDSNTPNPPDVCYTYRKGEETSTKKLTVAQTFL
jgi:hypothetical protein